jgi:hypothetical protein
MKRFAIPWNFSVDHMMRAFDNEIQADYWS